MQIDLLAFDLVNVLVDFDHTVAAKRISHFCDKNQKEIFSLFFSSGITGLFEEGKVSPLDFYIKVKEMLNLKLSYESFVHIWNEVFMLSPKNRAVYSLINNLRSRYKTVLISNTNILHYEYLKNKFPVFNVFHDEFISCILGLVKPDPLIYKIMLEKLNTLPENIFYTDDRVDLVDAARKIGINSFVFKDFNQLKSDLYAVGVS